MMTNQFFCTLFLAASADRSPSWHMLVVGKTAPSALHSGALVVGVAARAPKTARQTSKDTETTLAAQTVAASTPSPRGLYDRGFGESRPRTQRSPRFQQRQPIRVARRHSRHAEVDKQAIHPGACTA